MHGANAQVFCQHFSLLMPKWEEAPIVRGNERFVALCVELAAENNFRIGNPELKEEFQKARERNVLRRQRMTQRDSRDELHRASGVGRDLVGVASIPSGWDAAIQAYARQLRDIAIDPRKQKMDLSRLDAMVALRMRITGHSSAEIERTVRTVAPVVHKKDSARDWNHYAKRTMAFAFGSVATDSVRACRIIALGGY